MNPHPKVLCLGEALVDRLGPLGVDPSTAAFIHCDDRLGGAPANVALGLARLGTSSAFIGRVGFDSIGASIQDAMASRGINLAGLQFDSIRPSRVVLVRRCRDGERIFQGFVGDMGHGFSDQALAISEIRAVWPVLSSYADWLVLGTNSLANFVSAETQRWVLREAQSTGIKVALDVNWRPCFWDPALDPASGPAPAILNYFQPFISAASLLKLAKEEAIWLFGSDDPSEISSRLTKSPDVVVTDGGNPVRWHLNSSSGMLEVLAPKHIIDTTGAGDAFLAGLLHHLVQNHDNSVSSDYILRFAAACGSIVCGGSGAIDPQPDVSAVNKFLRN